MNQSISKSDIAIVGMGTALLVQSEIPMLVDVPSYASAVKEQDHVLL